jgi:hypothetical protein
VNLKANSVCPRSLAEGFGMKLRRRRGSTPMYDQALGTMFVFQKELFLNKVDNLSAN